MTILLTPIKNPIKGRSVRPVNASESSLGGLFSGAWNLYYSIKSEQPAEFRLSHRSLLPAQSTRDGFCDEQ